jgi:hypothetical protein
MTTKTIEVGLWVRVESIVPHGYPEHQGSWQNAEVTAHHRFVGKTGLVKSVDRDDYIPVLVELDGKERRFRREELAVV